MMYRSSGYMELTVTEVGKKLREVVPKYQRLVSPDLPQPDLAREWIATFLEVHKRFSEGDKRHTSREFGQIAELAQWLANLHAVINKSPFKKLNFVEELAIIRDKVYG